MRRESLTLARLRPVLVTGGLQAFTCGEAWKGLSPNMGPASQDVEEEGSVK